jgi:hypothetical protein
VSFRGSHLPDGHSARVAVRAWGFRLGHAPLFRPDAIPRNSTMQPAVLGRVGERRAPIVTVGDLDAIRARQDAYAGLSAAESVALQEPGVRRRVDEALDRFGLTSARPVLREIMRQQAQPIVVACGSQLVIRSTDAIRRRVGHASRHRSSRSARRPRSCRRGSHSGGNRDGPSDSTEGGGDGPSPPGRGRLEHACKLSGSETGQARTGGGAR